LKALHKAIKLSEPALLSADATVTSLGAKQEVTIKAFFLTYLCLDFK
jgi:hypothetical protein